MPIIKSHRHKRYKKSGGGQGHRVERRNRMHFRRIQFLYNTITVSVAMAGRQRAMVGR